MRSFFDYVLACLHLARDLLKNQITWILLGIGLAIGIAIGLLIP